MYEIFSRSFIHDSQMVADEVASLGTCHENDGYSRLILEFGGCSFGNALYRVMIPSAVWYWNNTIEYAFPQFKGRVQCFGYDWLGRVFAIDSARLEEGGAGVVMFEPGTAQVLQIPCDVVNFHNQELVDYREEALAESFHAQWLIRGATPGYQECIGYKVPLFLNGEDVVENLEVSNLDVYWTLMRQLIRKTRRNL